ncbi:MAG: MoaD/ThiS family protein [Bacteroidales bacterium]
MPQVTLLYFGAIRDITGLGSEEANAPGTLEALHRELLSRYPGLGAIRFRYSVNESLVPADRELEDGDVVALLPPFAGG